MAERNKIIIYQVFTRLFGNTNNHCITNGSIEDNGCGKFADFTPKALGEIKKLGTTHIGTPELLNTPLKPITAVTVFVPTIRP